MSALDRIIVALDSMTDREAVEFSTGAGKSFKFFKVGLELYLAYGKELLHKLCERKDIRLFLDLKLHDIPNTVAGAISSLEGLPIELLTIHISGGAQMIESALEAQKKFLPKTTLLGVSVLTSLESTDLKNIWGVSEESSASFGRLFTLAKNHGLQGLVCSAHEVQLAREIYGKNPVTIVTPGIRFKDETQGDQKRVLAPDEALKLGSHYLVMGRPLTKTNDIESRIELLKNIRI